MSTEDISTASTPAGPDSLRRLAQAASALRNDALVRRIHLGIQALRDDDPKTAFDVAKEVLEADEDLLLAWRLLAISAERTGDFTVAFFGNEQVIQRDPDTPGILNDLGRIAYHLKQFTQAEQFFLLHLRANPGEVDGVNNLACAIRDQNRLDQAAMVLKAALQENPQSALLWNTLATVMVAKGDSDNAMIFFDEAIRLDPTFSKAVYNRANQKSLLGDYEGALVDGEEALRLTGVPTDRAMMRMAVGLSKFTLGRIEEGLEDYQARLDPEFDESTRFPFPMPRWEGAEPLAGKGILVVGEQGLGDEVAFASLVPDIIEAVGPEGKVFLAVEPRLIPLMQRSFPTTTVGAYITGKQGHATVRVAPFAEPLYDQIDYWTTMALPMKRFRLRIEDFPARRAFLVPDPQRVAHWRAELAKLDDRPKVGVVWKSLVIDPARSRQFTAFETWGRVISLPGVTMVNLQYGDCTAELAEAERLGLRLWTPPDIDLKNDLDDLAALCVALDLVIGPANATSNIAAACGGEVDLVALPGAWIQFGTEGWPIYPQLRVIQGRFGDWSGAMEGLRRDISERFGLSPD